MADGYRKNSFIVHTGRVSGDVEQAKQRTDIVKLNVSKAIAPQEHACMEPASASSMVQDGKTILYSCTQAPFEIRIKISWTGVLNLMTGSVFALLGVAFLMVIAGSLLLFHLESKILRPVGMFTENLQKYDNGDLTYQMSEGNLVELEQIDE